MQKSKKIVLFTLLFSSLFNLSKAQDKIIDQIVVVIGSNVILKSDIESVYLQNQAQGITSDGDMKCEILENLLIENLMVAEAELDTNIIVTDNQINQQLDNRVQYFLQHLGSEKEVENYFKKPLVQLKSELNDVIRKEILSSQMRNKIIGDLKANPSEVRYYYRNLPDTEKPQIKTKYEYATITAVPVISEEEENRVKEELRKIKQRVDEGENFQKFAVLYSEDGASKNGGDLGYFGRASMDPAFSAAAFNLKPGQTSNVVKSDFGYHLIQMVDRRGDKIRCRHIIMKPKVKAEVKEKAILLLDSIANAIRKNEITFADAAMRYSSDKNSRNNGGIVVNPTSLSSQFEAGELPPTVSKVLANLKINEISEPFIAIDEKQREVIQIVKLLDKVDAHVANLTEDYHLLSELYLQKKQDDKVQEWISERQSKTYIRIDPTYQNCDFKFKNWIK
jgi:peptidyl-prolyl cis-trans isomerase SurA